jgi:hypothetical protein
VPPALTPALALDYVRELSADVREAIVVGPGGELLAGPPELAGPAQALLEAMGDAGEVESVSPEGVVCAVRRQGRAGVAVCGRFALPGVVREDLRVALAALAGAAPPAAPATSSAVGSPALERAAGVLISAVQRHSRT